jgi:hypothetical protein
MNQGLKKFVGRGQWAKFLRFLPYNFFIFFGIEVGPWLIPPSLNLSLLELLEYTLSNVKTIFWGQLAGKTGVLSNPCGWNALHKFEVYLAGVCT